MTELKCTNCNLETSYADAAIADYERSCDESNNGKHEWIELD
jgi:hypothetical protein